MLEPGHGRLLLGGAGDVPIAGAVFLSAGSTVIYKYGASDERAWRLDPNNILDWEAIRRFADEGFDHADAGTFRISLGVVVTELVHCVLPGDTRPRDACPRRRARLGLPHSDTDRAPRARRGSVLLRGPTHPWAGSSAPSRPSWMLWPS
jgi:hypothetical protein